MMATHILAAGSAVAASGTNYTVIGILLAIFVPIFGALAASVGWYFRLQRHRADAVAMAADRKMLRRPGPLSPLPPLLIRTNHGSSPTHEGPAHGWGQEPTDGTR